MRYKYTTLGVLTLIVLASFAGFTMPTGFFSNPSTVVHTQNLRDLVYKFLGVDEYEFLITNDVQCQSVIKGALKDLLDTEPEQTEALNIPGEANGFSTLAYSKKYVIGTLSTVKGREFLKTTNPNEVPAKIKFENEKMIFSDFSRVSRSVKVNVELDGGIEGNTFVVKQAALQSNGVKCDFVSKE